MLQVGFIIGAGRSGSTILSAALGDDPRMVNVGELINLPVVFGRDDRYCSCGETFTSCPHWAQMVSSLCAEHGPDALERLQTLRFAHETNTREAMRRAIAFSKGAADPELEELAALITTLYRSAAKQTGASIIIDSSKLPTRAAIMTRGKGLDVSMIHLVREYQAIAASMMATHKYSPEKGLPSDMNPRHPALTTASWMKRNYQVRQVMKLVPDNKNIFVSFERLLQDPQAGLSKIGALYNAADIKLSPAIDLTAQHILEGNRLRMKKSATISKSDSIRVLDSKVHRFICDAIAYIPARIMGWTIR